MKRNLVYFSTLVFMASLFTHSATATGGGSGIEKASQTNSLSTILGSVDPKTRFHIVKLQQNLESGGKVNRAFINDFVSRASELKLLDINVSNPARYFKKFSGSHSEAFGLFITDSIEQMESLIQTPVETGEGDEPIALVDSEARRREFYKLLNETLEKLLNE